MVKVARAPVGAKKLNPFFASSQGSYLPACTTCGWVRLAAGGGATLPSGKDENIAGAIRAAPFAFHFFLVSIKALLASFTLTFARLIELVAPVQPALA